MSGGFWSRIKQLFSDTTAMTVLKSGGLQQDTLSQSELFIKQSLFFTRFLMVFFTFIFYILHGYYNPPESPAAVAGALVIWVLIWGLSYVYITPVDKPLIMVGLTAEVAIIGFLVVITGTGTSPLVWMIMSPIVAGLAYLPYRYSWCFLFLFLTALFYPAFWQGAMPFSPAGYLSVESLPRIVSQHGGIILAFIMITAVSQTATTLVKRMARAWEHRGDSKNRSQETMELISELHQDLSHITPNDYPGELPALLAHYASRINDGPAACLLEAGVDAGVPEPRSLTVCDETGILNSDCWQGEIQQQYRHLCDHSLQSVTSQLKGRGEFVARALTVQGTCHGMVCYVQTPEKTGNQEIEQTLVLLAQLGSLTLERLKTEKTRENWLLREEQKRIAGEIHDHVAPHLFSINCALSHLAQNLKASEIPAETTDHIALIRKTAGKASAELRSTIYNLGSSPLPGKDFVDYLALHLDEVGALNKINVTFEILGDAVHIRDELQPVLLRILKESCNNALRHGQCSALTVTLLVSPREIRLVVEDNGCGYRKKPLSSIHSRGLGLNNMRNMAETHQGTFSITGVPGEKTVVAVSFPGRLHPYRGIEEERGHEAITH